MGPVHGSANGFSLPVDHDAHQHLPSEMASQSPTKNRQLYIFWQSRYIFCVSMQDEVDI